MNPSAQAQRPRSFESAFTLIELLVVVAIIALLISILLPSLQKAREQAKKTVCASNMRSMGQAFAMYADDYHGVWPSAVDSLGSQNRWPVPFFQAKIIHQTLNQYDAAGDVISEGGKSVFLCPSEVAPRTIKDWGTPPHAVDRVEIGGSYSYSGEIHRRGSVLELGTSTNPPFLKQIDSLKRTSDVFALFDNFRPIEKVTDFGWRFYRDTFFLGYRTINGDPVPPSSTADKYKVVGDRHSGEANAMAYDTHVESVYPDKLRYAQISWDPWDKYPELPPGGE